MTLSKRTIEVSKAQAAVGAGLLHRRALLTGSMAIAGALCAGVRPEAAPVSAAPDSAPLDAKAEARKIGHCHVGQE